MNTLNNYISEKLFVDTEVEITSAINRPMVKKELESILINIFKCSVTINDNNEIFINGGNLILNNKNLKILGRIFKNSNYRIKYCEVITFDKINVDTLPQWINGADVCNLVFKINKPDMILKNISFNLNNLYKNPLFIPIITFEIYKGANLPDVENITFKNEDKTSYLNISFHEKFDFDNLNYNFFNGIDIKGNNIEYVSLYLFNTDSYKFTNAKYVEEFIDYKIKLHKELYNFYKKYCKYISITYKFKNRYNIYSFKK